MSTDSLGRDPEWHPAPGEPRTWDVVDAVRRWTSARSYAQLLTPTTSLFLERSPQLEHFEERHTFVYACENHRRELGTSTSVPSLDGLLGALERSKPSVDVVFADPWHSYDDSLKIMCAGISMLNPGGHLLVHDCGPWLSEFVVDSPDTVWDTWCGETWRAFVDLAANLRNGWDWYVIDTDFGIGVIRAPEEAVLAADRPGPLQCGQRAVPAELSPVEAWSWLVPRRYDVLRLVSSASLGITTSDTSTSGQRPLEQLTGSEQVVTPSARPWNPARGGVHERSADSMHETVRPELVGKCPMCGKASTFSVTSTNFRESLICAHCFSTSRYRSIALGVLRAIRELTGVESLSIADLPRVADVTLRVLDTQPCFDSAPNARYMLPAMLEACSWIEVHTSSFQPTLPWGAGLGGTTTNQNLEALTFADGVFDVLITSDVLGDVRLYELAHAEIARVVRAGGVYLFTVPHGREMYEHSVRARIHDPGEPSTDEFVLPRVYHGSPGPGEELALSFRVFGAKIDDELTALGFEVEYSCDTRRDLAIFETELFYCRRQ